MVSVVNKINKYRKKAGLSQTKLGDSMETKTHKATISNYETSRREPKIQVIYQILAVLNENGADCSVEQLFPELKTASA